MYLERQRRVIERGWKCDSSWAANTIILLLGDHLVVLTVKYAIALDPKAVLLCSVLSGSEKGGRISWAWNRIDPQSVNVKTRKETGRSESWMGNFSPTPYSSDLFPTHGFGDISPPINYPTIVYSACC